MKYLTRFSEWSANDQLIFSSAAMEHAKHSFIDKTVISTKLAKLNNILNKFNVTIDTLNIIIFFYAL